MQEEVDGLMYKI